MEDNPNQADRAPKISDQPLEPVDTTQPNLVEVTPPSVSSATKFHLSSFHLTTRIIFLVSGVVVAAVVAGILVSGHSNVGKDTIVEKISKQTATSSPTPAAKATPTNTPTPVSTPPTTTTMSKPTTPAVSPAPMPTPVPSPAPTPSPALNTTNCLPANPSSYETTYTKYTNAQYLQTNSYSNSTKIYAALQFAGLIDTINSRQYVVLAMDNSEWARFSSAQLSWMNASPANMRSVLGWQVITSCITYGGQNPVKDLAAGTTRSVSTLNGVITFTAKAHGLGTFGSADVYIWDWFTSNGSATIAGFVNTTSIP